jgi:hypothetical protein
MTQMDILKMLAELRAEREQVEEAIMVLERIALGGRRRRGRPPAWMMARTNGQSSKASPEGRTRFSPESRRRMAESQRRRRARERKPASG